MKRPDNLEEFQRKMKERNTTKEIPMTATIIPMTKPTLDEHAKEIRVLVKRSNADIVEIGRRLSECRTVLKENGKWQSWLKAEFGWSERTAYNYIGLYENPDLQCVASLDLPRRSQYLLAAPTTSKESRDAVIKRVQKGEKMSHAAVKAAVRKNKKPVINAGSTREKVINIFKASKSGMSTNAAKAALPKLHPQTVNSTINTLVKLGLLNDTGRKEASTGGGRASIIYAYVENPKPKAGDVKSSRMTDEQLREAVMRLDEGQFLELACQWLAKWAEKNTKKGESISTDRAVRERAKKLYPLVRAALGKEYNAIKALTHVQEAVATQEGRGSFGKIELR